MVAKERLWAGTDIGYIILVQRLRTTRIPMRVEVVTMALLQAVE